MDDNDANALTRFINFGGNQGWHAQCYRPPSEAELLEILSRHPGATIRATASGHSWSDIAANADIALDVSALDSVTPLTVNGETLVRVGAGCKLQNLLDRLNAMNGRTLPTLGAIKRQTISGAISTGTHGSGKQSLSHFVAGVRLAVFDGADGRWVIREITEGAPLEAARCGLGCAGIIVSVDLHTVPNYMVTETVRTRQSVEEIVAAFADNPLSNFVLSPYGWIFSMFERKAVETRKRTLFELLKARFFRLYGLFVLDISFHIGVLASRLLGPWAIRTYLRLIPHTLIRNCERIDDAEHVLTTHHYLFRHEEMEIFVREADLARAMGFARAAIECFAAVDVSFPEEFLPAVRAAGLESALKARRGSYTHHYPLFCRRILPDETMISMTASVDGPMYSISIFTYDPPGRRDAYYEFCRFLAYSMLRLVDARLHWGKHFPFRYADVAPRYDRLEEFRSICLAHDPNGVLRNGYTKHVLNLAPGPSPSPPSGG